MCAGLGLGQSIPLGSAFPAVSLPHVCLHVHVHPNSQGQVIVQAIPLSMNTSFCALLHASTLYIAATSIARKVYLKGTIISTYLS